MIEHPSEQARAWAMRRITDALAWCEEDPENETMAALLEQRIADAKRYYGIEFGEVTVSKNQRDGARPDTTQGTNAEQNNHLRAAAEMAHRMIGSAAACRVELEAAKKRGDASGDITELMETVALIRQGAESVRDELRARAK